MTKYNWVQKTLMLLSLSVFAAFMYFAFLIVENPEIKQGEVLGSSSVTTFSAQFLNEDYSFTDSIQSYGEVINAIDSIVKVEFEGGTTVVLSSSKFINASDSFELLQGVMFLDTKLDFEITVNGERIHIPANSVIVITSDGDIVPIRGVGVDSRGTVVEVGQVLKWLVDEHRLRPYNLAELEINLDTIKLIYTLWDIDELPAELNIFAPAM